MWPVQCSEVPCVAHLLGWLPFTSRFAFALLAAQQLSSTKSRPQRADKSVRCSRGQTLGHLWGPQYGWPGGLWRVLSSAPYIPLLGCPSLSTSPQSRGSPGSKWAVVCLQSAARPLTPRALVPCTMPCKEGRLPCTNHEASCRLAAWRHFWARWVGSGS